jgi:hypothetical protein
MVFDVSIHVCSEQMSIRFPQEQMLVKVPSIVAYALSSGGIAAVGKTEQDLQRECLTEWNTIRPDLGFARPFDIDEFNVKFAVAMIQYCTYLMLQETREAASGPRLFHRFAYSLDIDGFEELPVDVQLAFIYTLLSKPRVHSVSVKGQDEASKWHLQVADWMLRLSGAGGLLLAFVAIWKLPSAYLGITPMAETLVRVVIALVGAYLGLFLMTVLCVAIARVFIPETAIEAVFPTGAFPGFVTQWLKNRLLPKTQSLSDAP